MLNIRITQLVTDRTDQTLNRYLTELNAISLIDAREEVLLAQKIRAGDKAAEQKLITANLRFVVSCAKKYQNMGVPLIDLICEGNIGLIKAARLFDETRGFKFISYAVWWIRQSIIYAIGEHKRTVRIPMNQQLGITNLKKLSDKLEQRLEREPTLNELSEILCKSEEQLADFIRCNTKVSYLGDIIPGASETNTLLEFLPDKSIPDITADWIELQDQQQRVTMLLNMLEPREQKILQHAFGLGTTPLNEEDLAAEMNLSKERIRQIKVQTIKKLRNYAKHP